jgi:hypothetical protein
MDALTAESLFDALARECGAEEVWRGPFVRTATVLTSLRPDGCYTFRFRGLGHHWTVRYSSSHALASCDAPACREALRRVNVRLARLVALTA